MAIKVLDSGVLNSYLRLLAVSGIHVKGDKFAFFVFLSWSTFASFSLAQMIYSSYYFKEDLTQLAVIVHHFVLVLDILISAVWSYAKREVWTAMFTDIDETYDYKSELMSNYLVRVCDERRNQLKVALNVLHYTMYFLVVNFVMMATFEKHWNNHGYTTLFPVYVPLDLENWFNFSLVITWQIFVIFGVCLIPFAILAALFLIYNFVSCEFELLNHAMLTTEERANELYNRLYRSKGNNKLKMMMECFKISMDHCARHHSLIISYFNKVLRAIRFSYLVIVSTGLVIFVCAGFTVVGENLFIKVKFMAILLIQFIHLYVCFWFGEAISEVSESIRWTVYDMDFMKMPKNCQSTLRMIMVRTMKPLALTTSTGQHINLDNYMNASAQLVKASYSYFNMILQTDQK